MGGYCKCMSGIRKAHLPAPEPICGHCSRPMRGSASLNDTALCHPDDGMDCYRLVTIYKHEMPCMRISCLHIPGGAERPILVAGLMRCCIHTICTTTTPSRAGDTLDCEHCPNRMIVGGNGKWQWSRNRRP